MSFHINLGSGGIWRLGLHWTSCMEPSTGVVLENAATLFCCEAPKNVLWTMKLFSFLGELIL